MGIILLQFRVKNIFILIQSLSMEEPYFLYQSFMNYKQLHSLSDNDKIFVNEKLLYFTYEQKLAFTRLIIENAKIKGKLDKNDENSIPYGGVEEHGNIKFNFSNLNEELLHILFKFVEIICKKETEK